MEEEKKKQVESSVRQGKKFRSSKPSGKDGGKWPQKKSRSLISFSLSSVLFLYSKLPRNHQSYFSGGFRSQGATP